MRKQWVGLLAVGLLLALSQGCGPKMASQETLNQIQECEAAYQSATQKKAQLEKQIADLKGQIPQLQQELQKLESQRDSLKAWLDLLEQGY